ncbi:transposase [Patescibacteria group bacterium]|nr:transposase [Patescibacteria group bacterium]MBU2010433.1 transposase [Patescibacteria group bacterium]
MREKVFSGNIYHTLSRGVDKRKMFLDNGDYLRFIHDLFEFNDTAPINNTTYRFRTRANSKVIARPYIDKDRKNKKPRKLLVEVLAFCLMPNHYHLLLKPRFDDGITKFLKRLNMGYSRYFNEKYKRQGTLFEGRYKLIAIINESHFLHIPYYIHLNPLSIKFPEWKSKKIKNYSEAMKFLESYRWSSFQDYIGKKNFPSVTQREFLLGLFEGPIQYKNDTEKWLQERNFKKNEDIFLE